MREAKGFRDFAIKVFVHFIHRVDQAVFFVDEVHRDIFVPGDESSYPLVFDEFIIGDKMSMVFWQVKANLSSHCSVHLEHQRVISNNLLHCAVFEVSQLLRNREVGQDLLVDG